MWQKNFLYKIAMFYISHYILSFKSEVTCVFFNLLCRGRSTIFPRINGADRKAMTKINAALE